jgi:hypothetical protein
MIINSQENGIFYLTIDKEEDELNRKKDKVNFRSMNTPVDKETKKFVNSCKDEHRLYQGQIVELAFAVFMTLYNSGKIVLQVKEPAKIDETIVPTIFSDEK